MIAELVSLDAERELLGALLFHGREAWLRVQPLGLTPAALSPEHRGLYRVLSYLAERAAPTSPAMIAEAAITLGESAIAEDPAGTMAAVAEALGDLPGVAHHAAVVADLAFRREVVSTAEALGRSASDRAVGVDLIVREQFGKLTARRGKASATSDALSDALADLAMEHTMGGLPRGCPTGLSKLDEALDGLAPERLIVLAARPGCGKTSFAIWLAHHTADAGVPVLMVTLEMPARQLWRRRLAIALNCDLRGEVRAGRWPHWEPRVTAIRPVLEAVPLVFDEVSNTVSEIAFAVHRMKSEERAPKLVIVDHLSWVQSGAADSVGHHLAVGRITKGLARLAKDEDCAVLLLVQLNRESVKGGTKPRRPGLSDLRDSGEIEQDADQVIMLWEPDADETPGPEAVMEFHVPKNRHGPLVTTQARWRKALYSYEQHWRYGIENGRAA